jgi:hypothetical protein
MDTSPNNYPQLCFAAGLTCQVCTRETARQLAQACKGLKGKMIGQMFVTIHTHSACAPMHAYFAECYRSYSLQETEAEEIARKPAARAMTAAAAA